MSYTANTVVDGTGTIATLNVSQQVIGSNVARQGFIFINNSGVTMYLRPGSSAATTSHIPVLAGATFTMLADVCLGTAWQVICGTATSAYYYAEMY